MKIVNNLFERVRNEVHKHFSKCSETVVFHTLKTNVLWVLAWHNLCHTLWLLHISTFITHILIIVCVYYSFFSLLFSWIFHRALDGRTFGIFRGFFMYSKAAVTKQCHVGDDWDRRARICLEWRYFLCIVKFFQVCIFLTFRLLA